MEKAGLIDRVNALTLNGTEQMLAEQESPTAQKGIEARRNILETAKAVGETRDPDLILARTDSGKRANHSEE